MNLRKMSAFRPTALAVALLATAAFAPAFAANANTCGLNDGIDDAIEQDGGSTAMVNAVACGITNTAL